MVSLTMVLLLEVHVVPKTDYKQCRYLPTGYIICVVQMLSQVPDFRLIVVTSQDFYQKVLHADL